MVSDLKRGILGQARTRDRERPVSRQREIDREGLAAIYEEYYQPIYCYVYRQVSDVETARDLAAERQIAITVGATGNPTAQTGCVLGSSYCVDCGACVQPAFYERRPWPLTQDLDGLIQRIQAFACQVWPDEPGDVRALREVSKPPMGNLPCVFYANANLFWSGEDIQVARERAKGGELPMEYLNKHLAASLNRHAARLSKWGFSETIGLLKDVISFPLRTTAR